MEANNNTELFNQALDCGMDEVDGNYRPPTSSTSSSGITGGRQLTFKDYGERIKELEGENFQLKVRIHLMEQHKNFKQRTGIVEHSQNNSNPGGHDASGFTTAANEIVTQFQQLKKENESLNIRLVTNENRFKQLEEDKKEILEREQGHVEQNQELNHKLDLLDRELALIKWKKDDDDEIEKCVKAFSCGINSPAYNNNEAPTVEQNNILLLNNEKQQLLIHSLSDENENLKLEIAGLRNELLKKKVENEKLLLKTCQRRELIERLRDDNVGLTAKISTTCFTLRDMGNQFNAAKQETKILTAENEELRQNMSSQTAALEHTLKLNNQLQREKASLKEKLSLSEKLHSEYGKLVTELKTLRSVCPVDETYERYFTVGLTRSVSHQEIREDPSPDLGIETDQEAVASSAAQQVTSHERALEKTLGKLDKTTKEKEEFEKAICRQLHRTHTILQDATNDLEGPESLPPENAKTTHASAAQSEHDRNNYNQFVFTQTC